MGGFVLGAGVFSGGDWVLVGKGGTGLLRDCWEALGVLWNRLDTLPRRPNFIVAKAPPPRRMIKIKRVTMTFLALLGVTVTSTPMAG